MKTYTNVFEAIREGKPVSDVERDYALVLAHYLLMRLYFGGKKVMSLDTTKERDKFESILETIEDYLSRDMEPLIKGSSMEPGISKEERENRATKSIADVATRLHNILNAK